MLKDDRAKFKKAIAKIIAAAWEDPNHFLPDLLSAGDDQDKIQTVVGSQNIELPPLPGLPDGTKIQFVANTETLRYIVIPVAPKFSDVDMSVLAQVRQQQIVECCCSRGFVEFIKAMVEEAVQEAAEEEAGNEPQG